MNIENEIFKKTKIDFSKLESYGFKKEKNFYIYKTKFMNNFEAIIEVIDDGKISGKIMDINVNEEYINYRIANQIGEFVSRVREEYKNILNDIKEKCTIKKYFLTDQANRITQMIFDIYHDEPEFVWESYPDFGIFRNPHNKKWYGLLFNIDKKKLDKKTTSEVEAINIKLDTEDIPKLLKQKGFYEAYHMNKKNWITIALDDTLKDEEILEFVKKSHKYTESLGEWIIPANPNYYDVLNCFNTTDTILWKQARGIKVGDIAYLYVASPISAILYKCEVIETGIPYTYEDENLAMKQVMKIKLLEEYDKEKYPFSKLYELGIKAIRGPRRITKEFNNVINKKEKES